MTVLYAGLLECLQQESLADSSIVGTAKATALEDHHLALHL